MNGENPYAPPAVAEPEAQSARYWRTYGTSLIVKNGATLPKIDLETGVTETEGNLKPLQRIQQNFSGGAVFRLIALVAIYLVLSEYFHIRGISVFIYFFVASIVLRRLGALRGTPGGNVSIWTFTEARRAKRATIRRVVRLVGLALLLFSLFIIPMVVSDYSGTWFLKVYLGWLVLIIVLALWAFFDRAKYKIHSADPGWLRITPIHPKALEFLTNIEAAQNQQEFGNPLPRKRLVHTTWYWRYPLRLLIGHRSRNPLFILRAALAKLLRSPLLVRDSYHFSETKSIPMENLTPPLREAVESWLNHHSDWTFFRAEHLPSPAGDLMIDTAYLASPGLEHCARITRGWMVQKPDGAINHVTFITWLHDGRYLFTYDQPFLVLSDKNIHHRTSGPPESVYQSHLVHLMDLSIHPATDPDDLRARLYQLNDETDRLLTEKGLQSPAREAC